MTYRLVQKGAGDVRPLVIVYHLTAELDEIVRRACPPEALILNSTGAAFGGAYARVGAPAVQPLAAVRAYAKSLGAFELGRIVLVGFSEGCQAVRAHLTAGQWPDGALAADGSHASLPPSDVQIGPWKDMMAMAEGTDARFFASHTEIRTDRVKPPYMPTRQVLERVTGWALGPATPEDDPTAPYGATGYVVRESETRHTRIRSYPGNAAKDHVHQAKLALPEQLQEMFESWKETDAARA